MFLQAEDGIRDKLVTGVQTCALPIFGPPVLHIARLRYGGLAARSEIDGAQERVSVDRAGPGRGKIGRASCRERVWMLVAAVSSYQVKRQVERENRLQFEAAVSYVFASRRRHTR